MLRFLDWVLWEIAYCDFRKTVDHIVPWRRKKYTIITQFDGERPCILLPDFGFGIPMSFLACALRKVCKIKIKERSFTFGAYYYVIIIESNEYKFYTDDWGGSDLFSQCDNLESVVELEKILYKTNLF